MHIFCKYSGWNDYCFQIHTTRDMQYQLRMVQLRTCAVCGKRQLRHLVMQHSHLERDYAAFGNTATELNAILHQTNQSKQVRD